MQSTQCTFRLPNEVIELIDKQRGRTRTDKLLNLIGFNEGEEKETIEERLEKLEKKVMNLEKLKSPSSKKNKSSANESRAMEARERVFRSLDELNKNNEIPTYRDKPSISKIAEITGIDRGTISKNITDWSEYESFVKARS
jgi:hypothetical protein